MTPAIACGLLFEKNQLIVGPLRWAYQLLRQTIGERFMNKSKPCIFIDRSFINMIGLRSQMISVASSIIYFSARNRFSLQTLRKKTFFVVQFCDRNDL